MTVNWLLAGAIATLVVAMTVQSHSADDTNTRLFAAIRAGDAATVETLVGADHALAAARNAQHVSAVMMALYSRHEELVAVLERHGATLDIFEASAAGRVARLQDILSHDPTAIAQFSPDGFPPLGLAAFFGRRDAVVFLLERGADVNAASKNAQRVCALHAAVAGPDPDIARLLLQRGARAGARQEGGFTALHEVASKGLTDLARALVDAGADRFAKSDDGTTPADLATKNNHSALAAMLRQPDR